MANACNHMLNRAASIPFVGTPIGIIRAGVAFVVMIVTPIIALIASLFMGMGWFFHSKCWRWSFVEGCGKVFLSSISHFFVGLAEIIPGVGGLVHLCLHNCALGGDNPENNTWYWGKGGCLEGCCSEEINYSM